MTEQTAAGADESRVGELEARLAAAERTELERWEAAVEEGRRLRLELERIHQTVSWRVTAPLRAVRRRQLEG